MISRDIIAKLAGKEFNPSDGLIHLDHDEFHIFLVKLGDYLVEQNPELCSTNAVAYTFGFNVSTVQGWFNRGSTPTIKKYVDAFKKIGILLPPKQWRCGATKELKSETIDPSTIQTITPIQEECPYSKLEAMLADEVLKLNNDVNYESEDSTMAVVYKIRADYKKFNKK